MARLNASPEQIATMKQFLAECCPLIHIDHIDFERPPSGIALVIHYRDGKDHPHKKTITNPDASTWGDIEDLVVIASEWLSHDASRQMDALSATVH